MNSVSLPVSSILRSRAAEAASDEPKKNTREEWKKAKELEEARKAGTVPAAVDEEGHDINPHIPQYISAAPWYYNTVGPTLKHQRPQPEKLHEVTHLTEHYTRGQRGQMAIKYRKGACENCGGMGHTRKECMERPRKIGAKFTGSLIAPDDVALPDLSLDFDGKRDRWNGYDPAEYRAVVAEHEKIEEYKRQVKATKLKDGQDLEDDGDPEDDEDDDGDKYAESIDMPGTKVDSKQRITVRNLRIREDTAKYLRNLDPNSAYYDPKTRSMRDNPYAETSKGSEDVDFAGENFIRFTGDTVTQAKAQLFAWDAYEKGVDVNLMSEPTKLELLQRQFSEKKEEFKQKVSNDLLDRYGGKEHLDVPARELLLAQTENYVEYSRQGKVVRGAVMHGIRSIYEEDVYPGNHTSVWGSFWRDGVWGFKCCHSMVKNSYCTGESGKEANNTQALIPSTSMHAINDDENEKEEIEKTLVELHKEEKAKKKRASKRKKNKKQRDAAKKRHKKDSGSCSSSSSSSSSDSEEEPEEEQRKRKLREALLRAHLADQLADTEAGMDERKRKYNSMYNAKAPTEEELEAYHMRRARDNDPMAAFSSK